MPSFSLVCSVQIYFAPRSKLSRHALYTARAANMFLWWCQTMGSQKAGPVRLELETNEVERVCVCALLCFCTLRRLVLTHPVLGPMMIGKPCVGSWAYRRRNPTCQEPTGVPKHLRICAKKMAIRGISSTATLAHIENCFPAGVATPRRRKKPWWGPRPPAKSLLLQFQWTFTSPLFPAHGPLPSEDHAPAKSKSETRMIKQMPSMPWTVFLRPLHFVFSRMYLPGSNAKALTEPERSCHNVTERLIFKKISVPSDKNLGFFPHKENAAHASLDKRCHFFSAFASRSWPGRGPQENSTNTFHA